MSAPAATSGSRPARRGAVALGIFAGFVLALFLLVPDGWYLWIKALHVVAVIAWMAGLLYLPRLFVYHSEATPGSEKSEIFKVMERRLLRAIVNPAMIATWSFGLWLGWKGFLFQAGWLHAKILLVVLLSAFHGYLARGVRLFAAARNTAGTKQWRVMNEVPTLLMIAIVILAVVKPF